MVGWIIPPPKPPIKSKSKLLIEKQKKIVWLKNQGFLKSKRIEDAMLKVPRELFVPYFYRDHTYEELPFPLPGKNSTISCPHSYPMFYEAINLTKGDNFLEVGTGSGYGAVLAREIVGSLGRVTTIEIDSATIQYARQIINTFNYHNLYVIKGDGGNGYEVHAPYDKICITVACPKIPPPLIAQLKEGGTLITPCLTTRPIQDLIVLEKHKDGTIIKRVVEKVLYVLLQGDYATEI